MLQWWSLWCVGFIISSLCCPMTHLPFPRLNSSSHLSRGTTTPGQFTYSCINSWKTTATMCKPRLLAKRFSLLLLKTLQGPPQWPPALISMMTMTWMGVNPIYYSLTLMMIEAMSFLYLYYVLEHWIKYTFSPHISAQGQAQTILDRKWPRTLTKSMIYPQDKCLWHIMVSVLHPSLGYL